MDFIERWFGVSPDGGSGALEAFYVAAALAVVVVLVARRLLQRTKASPERRERP